MIGDIVVLALIAAGASGCVIMLMAAVALPRPSLLKWITTGSAPAVTILKPLHGDEAGLFENLASFCRQEYEGPVQIVFGVASNDDPAVRIVERLRQSYPGAALDLVIDSRVAGSNPKVANLINMSSRIAHDIVVLSDSDIRVAPDYLSRIVIALRHAGNGAVTCPYYGISTGNLWSRLAQLHVDGHFLPGVVLGSRLHLTRPCLGSTIALHRQSLSAIGGIEAVADCLADDYELGAALIERGEPVTLLPFAVGHICDESSFRELWRHELRWMLTIRTIDLPGYCGWTVTHAFPLALIALAFGAGWPAIWLGLTALACRAVLLLAVERSYGLPPRSYWLIPLRDLLSFIVFIAGFFAQDVNWRGRRYKLMSEGTMQSDRRPPAP
jgi:ceramide glucosyltransferase